MYDQANVTVDLFPLTMAFEKRGVSLILFQRIRDIALALDPTPDVWSIGRVSALIVGNHEILKAGNRWGPELDPSSTLTYACQCSLIDMLQQGKFNAPESALYGLQYEQVVGEKADIFISFAYATDFIELVDALESFFEHNASSLDSASVYLWFDLFVNNQWVALDRTFEWWATTFKEAVEEIGHTLCILLPWDKPVPLTRVWCLFEISCSKKLSIGISKKQVAAFQQTLRSDYDAIVASLCEIDLELATSFLPEDKDRTFAVVREVPGGFHGFNVKVTRMIRQRVEVTAQKLLSQASSENEGEEGEARGQEKKKQTDLRLLADMHSMAMLLKEENKFKEAIEMNLKVIEGYESFGDEQLLGQSAARANLGSLFLEQNRFSEAEVIIRQAIAGFETIFGMQHIRTLKAIGTLGVCFRAQYRISEAEPLFRQALSGFEELLGKHHSQTLTARNLLGTLLILQKKNEEAETYLLETLEGRELTSGKHHPDTLDCIGNLAILSQRLCKFEQAEAFYARVLEGSEKIFGVDHSRTVSTLQNMGILYSSQGKYEMAMSFYQRAFEGRKRVYGEEHLETLLVKHDIGLMHSDTGEIEEAVACFTEVGKVESMHPSAKKSHSYIKALRARVNEKELSRYPLHITAPFVHVCELTKTKNSFIGRFYGCDVCSEVGYEWGYQCSPCSFDAHFTCVCKE